MSDFGEESDVGELSPQGESDQAEPIIDKVKPLIPVYEAFTKISDEVLTQLEKYKLMP